MSDSRASESQSPNIENRSKSDTPLTNKQEGSSLDKTKLKPKKAEKSHFAKLFYKESFLIKYFDKPSKILQETDFHNEFKRLKPTDNYWNTI